MAEEGSCDQQNYTLCNQNACTLKSDQNGTVVFGFEHILSVMYNGVEYVIEH